MEMPGWLDRAGRHGRAHGRLLAGARQSREPGSIAGELEQIAIDRPIYVTGLARAGTTILLELLAGRPGVATHRYRDFPPVYTPIFWNRAFAHIYRSDTPPTERAHKDRILVTPDSPEAMEEVLWMRFFPQAHDTGTQPGAGRGDAATPPSSASTGSMSRRSCCVRGGRRYLSKGNYNLTPLRLSAEAVPRRALHGPGARSVAGTSRR